MYDIGVWVGNAFIVVGVVYLALRVYFSRQLARIRHEQTGQPIPARDFFEQMGTFFGLAFGFRRSFNPLGTSNLCNQQEILIIIVLFTNNKYCELVFVINGFCSK
jgi:hypothetical protein